MTNKIVDISDARASRDKASDQPSRFITVGGLVDETSVSLCVYGDDLVPENISKILGVTPTRAHRKDEHMKSRSAQTPRTATYRTGVWILEMRGKAPQEPEKLTTALFDLLPEDETLWVELAALYEIWLSYGLHLEAWNRGFTLPPELVARVARMRAKMNFDIYGNYEEEKS